MGEPAYLPSFKCLAKLIAHGTGEKLKEDEPVDQFLGRLKNERGTEVHELAAQKLSENIPKPTDLHRDLLRLYSKAESTRIITTNFDLLFEKAAQEMFELKPEVFRAPALPLGHDFNGIVHVHGAVSHPVEMVLTDEDFGRAYLTEGWARRFLLELFRSFTVLFVGYSHNDTIMNYLARALPISEDKLRFALKNEKPNEKDEKDENERWQFLGIVPISYPSSSEQDHDALYSGIYRLADNTARGILDWQREIMEIAGKPPSLNEEEMDLIEDALLDEMKTRFFADAASSPEWIDWLDQRKYLDSLFGTDELSDHKRKLAEWLANTFAREHSDSLFLLIGRHGMQLHTAFWFELGRTIKRQQDLPLGKDILSRWVSILLATIPAYPNKSVLLWLGERCIEVGLIDSLIDIFIACAINHLEIRSGFTLYNDDGEDPHPPIRVDLSSMSGHFEINQLWKNGLIPKLNQVAEPLLARVAEYLSSQHRILCAWGKTTRDDDSTSFRRSAIEPHQQDKHPEAVDVLIDTARDCLEYLVTNRPEEAARWCNQLVGAQAPLLRRLAVHTLSKRKDLNPNEKIDWILAHMDLHDTPAHHEVFLLLKQTYPKVDSKRREAVVEAIFVYRCPNEQDDKNERRTAYRHFMWFHWLYSADLDCTFAKEALEDVLERYPDFQPREHPDLLSWHGIGSGFQSPWTVEELLSRAAEEWVEALLSFQRIEILGPDRNGLVITVQDAAKQDFEWGIALAGELAKRSAWETDLWAVLIRAWTKELTEDKHRDVLHRLNRTELYEKHAYWIVDVLYALVRNGGVPYAPNLLRDANEIAVGLWKHIDHDEPTENPSDWLNQAINRTGGKMAEFWLGSLSLWRKQQVPKTDVLNGEYLEALSGIVEEKSLAGRLGRSVLASQLPFLLAVDEEWTKENLLPLFKAHDNIGEYQAVWDGFQYVSLSLPVAEFMKDTFLDAVSRIQSELFDGQRREAFIKAYTTMLVYFVDDPLKIWIPKFFCHTDEESRKIFASHIHLLFRGMDLDKQLEWWECWLKRYWQFRLQGKPIQLDLGEIEIMVQWLPYFRGAVFVEAVALAVQMEQVPLEHSPSAHEINESGLWQRYPEAVAKLLIYLDGCNLPIYSWHGAKVLIDELVASDIPGDFKEKLEELRASRGLG